MEGMEVDDGVDNHMNERVTAELQEQRNRDHEEVGCDRVLLDCAASCTQSDGDDDGSRMMMAAGRGEH